MKRQRMEETKSQQQKRLAPVAGKDLALKDAGVVTGGRKAGGTQQDYLKITMSDVLISSY